MQAVYDLNNLRIPCDDRDGRPLRDPGIGTTLANERALVPGADDTSFVRVHFRRLEDHLINYIGQADVVVGCVAWLTAPRILDALAQTKGVSFVIAKEPWLQPGETSSADWITHLRALYESLPPLPEGYCSDGILGCLDITRFDPVRCLGQIDDDLGGLGGRRPRLHDKFAVFCKLMGGYRILAPYAVWTGSYNFTAKSSRSLENGVYIHDAAVADAFYAEWQQLMALSETIHWSSERISPEYSIPV